MRRAVDTSLLTVGLRIVSADFGTLQPSYRPLEAESQVSLLTEVSREIFMHNTMSDRLTADIIIRIKHTVSMLQIITGSSFRCVHRCGRKP